MSFSDVQIEDDSEFCRKCGVTVSFTGEIWVHDYPVDDDHEPVVPSGYDEI